MYVTRVQFLERRDSTFFKLPNYTPYSLYKIVKNGLYIGKCIKI